MLIPAPLQIGLLRPQGPVLSDEHDAPNADRGRSGGRNPRIRPQASATAYGARRSDATEPGYCHARNGRSRSGWAVSGEAAYDRAARIGDGFLFSGRIQTEAVQIKARIVTKLRELGRDPDAFGFESIQRYDRGDNQWPGDIAAWRAAGGSHISVVTMGANLNTVDGHIAAIKRWRDVYNSSDRIAPRSPPPKPSPIMGKGCISTPIYIPAPSMGRVGWG
jgi:hypothetical protein